MLVIYCFPVFKFGILGSFNICCLARLGWHEFNMLLNEAFDLKYRYLASWMTAHNKNILIFVDPFHVHARNWMTFDSAVTQYLDFDLCTIIQTHSTIVRTHCNIFLQWGNTSRLFGFLTLTWCCYAPVCNLCKYLLMRQSALLLDLTSLITNTDQLGALIDHSLSVLLISALITIYDFKQMKFMSVFATCIPEEIGRIDCFFFRLQWSIEKILLRHYRTIRLRSFIRLWSLIALIIIVVIIKILLNHP